ncbi:MAG: TIR domain-containing protein [Steroidobacteraceae bacterium]
MTEPSETSRTTDARADNQRPSAFLSYARADKATAESLARALEQAGLSVWWDPMLEGGAEFARRIEAAIGTADAVVVAWSASSVGSDWVLDEAAKGRDLRKLVPVSIDGTEPPMGFRRYHTVDLAQWSGDPGAAEVAAIVRGVAALAGGATVDAPTAGRPPATDAISRRALLATGLGVAAIGAGGAFAWRRGAFRRWFGPTGNSVAVLPFDNLSGDPSQDYFSAGLAEEVRATLARNARLQVMAQASSATFAGSHEDAEGIAAKLGVSYLLTGSVRRSGDVVRVAADLIDGGTGFSRWSQSFDRRITDIFAVQSEIAATVAEALVARVSADSGAMTAMSNPDAAGSTSNISAFDAYLRGRALYDLSADEASERAALAQFDAAIAADRNYAAAWAARARSLTAIANQYAAVGQREGMYDEAIASAERAIAIAPDLADAHSTLGYTLFQGRLDARAARAPFERSLQTGAGEATVLARYAQYSARTGRVAEARSAMRRALPLDPLNPLIFRASGSIEYAARDYQASIGPARHALEMNPRLSRAHAAIGDALAMLGRPDDARTEYQAEPVADFSLAGLAIVERRLDRPADADQAYARLVTEVGDRALYQQAQVLAQRGDTDTALDRLEEARRLGDSGLIYARNDPFLDPVRSTPRFVRLLQSIGFD